MQDLWNVLFALAALVAILDYFGIKPGRKVGGPKMSLSRPWKLVIMLALVGASLGLSGYSFYRSMHPRIVEKIVEKPVDRIVDRVVEKQVPIPCPKSQPFTPKNKPQSNASTTTSGDNSPAVGGVNQGAGSIAQIGGTGNQAEVNNFAPPNRHLSPGGADSLAAFASTLPNDLSGELTIRSVNEAEPMKYADEITAAFQKHTKVGSDIGLAWDKIPEGVIVCALSKDAPIFPLAQQIVAELNRAGVQNITFEPCTRVDEHHTMIIVGVRPES